MSNRIEQDISTGSLVKHLANFYSGPDDTVLAEMVLKIAGERDALVKVLRQIEKLNVILPGKVYNAARAVLAKHKEPK